MNPEFRILLDWMEGTSDIHFKNPYFILKSDGVFAECQKISYKFIILKHI